MFHLSMALLHRLAGSILVLLCSTALVHSQLFFIQSLYSVTEDTSIVDSTTQTPNTVNVCYGYAFEVDNFPIMAVITTVDGTATGIVMIM